ncbi:MAG: zinc-ribbon domain-containing protein [bacterium]
MYCPQCGNYADENARFCRSCGHDLAAFRAQLPPSAQRRVVPPPADTRPVVIVKGAGLGAILLLVAIPFGLAVIGILAAIAIPQLLGAREKARAATCDNVYVALNGEVANELDAAMHGRTGKCAATTNDAVVSCMMRTHADEDNPRNRNQRAYTTAPGDSCQVQLSPLSSNGVTFSQIPNPSRPTRTFSIQVE